MIISTTAYMCKFKGSAYHAEKLQGLSEFTKKNGGSHAFSRQLALNPNKKC